MGAQAKVAIELPRIINGLTLINFARTNGYPPGAAGFTVDILYGLAWKTAMLRTPKIQRADWVRERMARGIAHKALMLDELDMGLLRTRVRKTGEKPPQWVLLLQHYLQELHELEL